MKIDLDFVRTTIRFEHIKPGEAFSHGDHIYIKLEHLIPIDQDQCNEGSTKVVGGYNAARLDNGRPGSFRSDTPVRAKDLIIVKRDT